MTLSLGLEVSGDGEEGLSIGDVTMLLAATLRVAALDGHVDAGVQWVDRARSAELNAEHRGVDGPTDVLSFPIDGDEELPPGIPRQLGDLAICTDVVRDQLSAGTTMAGDRDLTSALRRCVVHGALHLLGAEHDEPAGADAMFAAEQAILDATH